MDDQDYTTEHFAIFGHYPVPNVVTGQRCTHPDHDALGAMISAPGVDLEIEFVPQEIVGEDDPAVIAWNQDYDRKVEEYRDGIKRIEEEDEWKQKRKSQF